MMCRIEQMLSPRFRSLRGGVVLAAFAAFAGCEAKSHVPTRPWAGGLPIVTDANGDGVEDVFDLGITTMALDGRSYEPLWERTDLRVDLATLAGETLVAARERTLELVDVKTGKTRATIPLSDKVKSISKISTGVWVTLIDATHGLLDPVKGTLDKTAAPPPPEPASTALRRPDACQYASAECDGSYPSRNMVLRQGTSTVGIQIKEPGTPEVSIVLHDPAGRPTNRIPFDPTGNRLTAADLMGGKLFVLHGGALIAIDAATGATLWKVSCTSDAPFLRATPSRVYARCDGPKTYKALRIVGHDGKILATLGDVRRSPGLP